MKQVIVFPRGQLDSKDKERLTKAGVIAVEADDPSKVVTCMPVVGTAISTDDMLMSALHAMSGTSSYQERSNMVKELHQRLLNREKAAKGGG